MAKRRMFAKAIIDSDNFLDMSLSTQALYFHLAMRADDDGFVNNPKRIQRMVGASDDELKMLIAKQYIIPFESGVVVIKHWKIHNYIQKDRYHPSEFKERKSIMIDENNVYKKTDTLCIQNGHKMDSATDTKCGQKKTQPLINTGGYNTDTECIQNVSLGKVSKGKNRLVSSTKIESSNLESKDKPTNEPLNIFDDEYKPLLNFCQSNVEILTPVKAQILCSYVEDYGFEWVQKGLEYVASLPVNKNNLKYLGGVLDGWKKDGVPKPWERNRKKDNAQSSGIDVSMD